MCALSHTRWSLSIRHQVGSGTPFHANRNLRMDIVIEARRFRDAAASECRTKATLLDVTYADP